MSSWFSKVTLLFVTMGAAYGLGGVPASASTPEASPAAGDPVEPIALQAGATFSITAPSEYGFGDTPQQCCSSLFNSNTARDAGLSKACAAQNAFALLPARWSGGGQCQAHNNPSGGYKYRCAAVVEGTCRRR